MKSISLASLLILTAACSSTPALISPVAKDQALVSVTTFTMSNPPIVGTTMSGQKIKLGGFSGLQFIEEKAGAYYFQTITDRGPNGEPNGSDRAFLLPEYSPSIITLKADPSNRELSVVTEMKLKKSDGSPLTGLPNTRLEENPTDVFGFYYSIDKEGMDTEGLVSDSEGGWWISDEYGPSLAHVNAQGKMVRRLLPVQDLPRMYADRKTNRGFEGVAKFENHLFGILQSPLPYEKDFSRIVEVNSETLRINAEYFYPFEKGNDKIGDIVAINAKTLLVLEQNGKTGEQGQKFIYKIELGAGESPVAKSLLVDLKTTPFNNLEKIEGLAIVGKHGLALVYDNDFQLNGKTDPKTGLTPLNQSQNQMILLEFKQEL